VTRSLAGFVFGAIAVAAIAGCAAPSTGKVEGTTVHLESSGDVKLETGAYYGDRFEPASGQITIDATDVGDRVTPLPPHDRLSIAATIQASAGTITVSATDPMIEDPMGRWTTWWGVGIDVDHHGQSGIGTNLLPNIHSAVAAFGMGKVSVDDQVVADGVMVHIMTAENGLPGRLELDVGDPANPIPGLPDGHVRAVWADYQGDVPSGTKTARYFGGGVVLLMLLLGMIWLNTRNVVRG
jgi:hypothetical protein